MNLESYAPVQAVAMELKKQYDHEDLLTYRFGRLIRELRALPMATTPGGENNLLSAIFFRISYVPHSKCSIFKPAIFYEDFNKMNKY